MSFSSVQLRRCVRTSHALHRGALSYSSLSTALILLAKALSFLGPSVAKRFLAADINAS